MDFNFKSLWSAEEAEKEAGKIFFKADQKAFKQKLNQYVEL
jgi:hypothetical protein